jgi:hypothetical protein
MYILACPGFDSVTDFFSICDNIRDNMTSFKSVSSANESLQCLYIKKRCWFGVIISSKISSVYVRYYLSKSRIQKWMY